LNIPCILYTVNYGSFPAPPTTTTEQPHNTTNARGASHHQQPPKITGGKQQNAGQEKRSNSRHRKDKDNVHHSQPQQQQRRNNNAKTPFAAASKNIQNNTGVTLYTGLYDQVLRGDLGMQQPQPEDEATMMMMKVPLFCKGAGG
jgi:hypothetical protein